jgi:hypothetical protein
MSWSRRDVLKATATAVACPVLPALAHAAIPRALSTSLPSADAWLAAEGADADAFAAAYSGGLRRAPGHDPGVLLDWWRQSRPAAVQGLTGAAAFFVLSTALQRAGLRPVLIARHRYADAGLWHALEGGPTAPILAAALADTGAHWPTTLARCLPHMSGRAVTATATSAARLAPVQLPARSPDHLVSFVFTAA